MKALEKDLHLRYASASDLAADVGRHLNDERIEARPYSLRKRLQKLWKRGKGTATTLFLIALALYVGAVFKPFQEEPPRNPQQRESPMLLGKTLGIFRKSHGPSIGRKSRRRPAKIQAAVERLEDRAMLSVVTIDPGAYGGE